MKAISVISKGAREKKIIIRLTAHKQTGISDMWMIKIDEPELKMVSFCKEDEIEEVLRKKLIII